MTAPQWNVGDRMENRWEIHKILRGGMGIVYVVYDHEWHEVFAVKTFQDEVFARTPGTADRFAIEARSWVNLDVHQNVVQARFVQNIRGKPLLFLEYVSGGDLGGWIGTPRLTNDLPQALRFAIQFCDGMSHALSKGIQAHRDIKPQNCLVTQDNILKVTDFGLAKVFDETPADPAFAVISAGGPAIHLSVSGKAAGTCTHMAPEQFDDAKHVDVRADIYAFGVTLFQMVRGKLPFVGGTWDEFAQLHRTSPPPPLASGQSSLDSIVRKCLAKPAAERYAGFETLRAELASVYETTTGQSAPETAIGRQLNATELSNKAVALDSLGRYEDALACCDRALVIDPRHAAAWLNKGNAIGHMGRSEEAIACFDRVLEIDPRDAGAWHNKGFSLDRLGCSEEALACYDRAVDIDPQYAEAWSSRGATLWSLGRSEEALACYDRAIAIHPQLANSWNNKGNALDNLGRHEDALACYDHAIAINPQLADAWNGKGLTMWSLGRQDEALACYDRAIAINPQLSAAFSNKGNALNRLGRAQDALACFDRALALNPRLADAWSNKGGTLSGLGRFEEALACIDRALDIAPRHSSAWSNKGNALASLGRSGEALASYDRALDFDARHVDAWRNKGILLHSLQRPEEALACYDRAIAINPQFAEAWSCKGHALFTLGRSPEALACFDRALAINPEYAEAWSDKAVVLDNLRRYDEALACYTRAITINPQYAVAWFNKGAAFLNGFSNPQVAIHCFEQAQRLGHPKAAEAIAICRNMLAQPPRPPI
jgi:tetratricopeptide (TPR) repeat protein